MIPRFPMSLESAKEITEDFERRLKVRRERRQARALAKQLSPLPRMRGPAQPGSLRLKAYRAGACVVVLAALAVAVLMWLALGWF